MNFLFRSITIRYISSKIITKRIPYIAFTGGLLVSAQSLLYLLMFCFSVSSMLLLYHDTLVHVLTIHCCICKHSLIGCLHGITPDSKDHGANIGPIWGRQDPNVPHDGPWTLLQCIWDASVATRSSWSLWVYLSNDLGHSRLEYPYSL